MATKLSTLISIVTGYFSSTQLNSNFTAIADEFDNTLSRDGTAPNTMEADFDLNSNDLLNGANVHTDNLYIAGTKTVSTSATPTWKGPWVTTTVYALDDVVSDSGSSYICIVAHTGGTFATDLAALKWAAMATKGATGAGTGDMLIANNLSDVASVATAKVNLGVEVGVDVQAYGAILDDLSGLTQATDKIPYFTSGSAAGVLDLLDEDTMSSDSATGVPTQQSSKAYADTTLAAAVATIAAKPQIVAWVNFNGTGTPTVNASYNITSITDNGTGDWTINFTTNISDANYAVSFAINKTDTSTSFVRTRAVGSLRMGIQTTGVGAADASDISVVIVR